MHPFFTFLASFNFLSLFFILQLLLYFYYKKTPSFLSLLSKSSWRLVPCYSNKKPAFEIKGCGETDVPRMLSTAWCRTNKAASFCSTLHEYWRVQLIKGQHRQLHQPAVSSHSSQSKGRAWAPVWGHLSQELTLALCCSLCWPHRGSCSCHGPTPISFTSDNRLPCGFHASLCDKGDRASQWQKSRVTPDTQAQAKADSQPLWWPTKPSMNDKQKDEGRARDSCEELVTINKEQSTLHH